MSDPEIVSSGHIALYDTDDRELVGTRRPADVWLIHRPDGGQHYAVRARTGDRVNFRILEEPWVTARLLYIDPSDGRARELTDPRTFRAGDTLTVNLRTDTADGVITRTPYPVSLRERVLDWISVRLPWWWPW